MLLADLLLLACSICCFMQEIYINQNTSAIICCIFIIYLHCIRKSIFIKCLYSALQLWDEQNRRMFLVDLGDVNQDKMI